MGRTIEYMHHGSRCICIVYPIFKKLKGGTDFSTKFIIATYVDSPPFLVLIVPENIKKESTNEARKSRNPLLVCQNFTSTV